MDCNSTGYRLRNVTCINGTICSSLNKPHFNETCLVDCNNYIDSDLYVDLFIYMITNKPIENKTLFNITQIDQTISNVEQSKIDLNYSKNETNENNSTETTSIFNVEIEANNTNQTSFESNIESNRIFSNDQNNKNNLNHKHYHEIIKKTPESMYIRNF